jgi:hypothetical protein
MQRPENATLFFVLIFGGAVLMVAIGIACHLWARRIIFHGRFLALKICVPPLLTLLVIALFVIITATFSGFYSSSYGYQLQPGEPSGPLGTTGEWVGNLLILFGFALLVGYALYLTFLILRLLIKPE